MPLESCLLKRTRAAPATKAPELASKARNCETEFIDDGTVTEVKLVQKWRILLVAIAAGPLAAEPRGGEWFREFTYATRFSVLNPAAEAPNLETQGRQAMAERFLEIELGGARRAEVVVAYWGGHIGASGQAFQINGNGWIEIPQPQGTPTAPQCYHRTLLRATVEAPIAHLRTGLNAFRFRAGPQICHSSERGPYWVYSFTVRLYDDAPAHAPTGSIVSHSSGDVIGDFPQFLVEARSTHHPVVSVDWIAKYEDYNWEGDGIFRQWHYLLENGKLSRHVGSARNPPYRVQWDTRWIPDQTEPVEVAARITDATGLTYQTPSVRLTLRRDGRSVRLYRASQVPEAFAVRAGARRSCVIDVDGDISRIRAARLVLSTFSGAHAEEIGLNGRKLVNRAGLVHNYSFDSIPVPVSLVQRGQNTFHIYSTTQEHAAEINWPGPALLVELAPPPQVWPASVAWEVPSATHRVAVEVDPGRWERWDRFVEAPLRNVPAGVVPTHVYELEDGRAKLVEAFQFDREDRTSGTVIFPLTGRTPAHRIRRFLVYFGEKSGQAPSPAVRVTDGVEWQGQDSFRIDTSSASYIYHKEGAGFASIVDPAGDDWLSYRPSGGSAGHFRGIPNLHPEFGHPGYSGKQGSTSRVTSHGPLRLSILSESASGRWAVRWDIFPGFARMMMLKAGAPYWFLYEGTPGGKMDTTQGYFALSNGEVWPLKHSWTGYLEGPKWVYFASPPSQWCLFAASHQDEGAPDQYWPMQNNMTVFGFGRRYQSGGYYLTHNQAVYTIGILPHANFAATSSRILSAVSELAVAVGQIESRPR